MAERKKKIGGERGSEPVRIWLLGRFRVQVGDRVMREEDWRLKKAAGIVKLLALAPGHRLHRERVLEALWPDQDPKSAANNLRYALHVARKTLDGNPHTARRYLAWEGDQLALCPEGLLQVDVEAFEEAASTARRAREPAAYRSAAELYAGELLPGDRYEEWAQGRREELRQTYLSLLVELAELYEESGDRRAAIEMLRRAVAEEPRLQEASLGLMRLYAAGGERYRAIREYERLCESLKGEPGEEIRKLYEEIRAGSHTGTSPGPRLQARSASQRHNLPYAVTSFVGREREMREVKRLLAMSRLLTITGFGGCGKTRLALEVAGDITGLYPDGVWLVELAEISDPELVSQTVAGVLSVPEHPDCTPTETLADALQDKHMLLILDNCEHLIPGCTQLVDALLRSCEHLRVLATSREALDVIGEVVWRVPPLSVPEMGDLDTTESLERYEAVRLFVERVRLKLPTFALTPQNARSVAEICRRLGGIPLAIELATARASMLAVEQVAGRLDDSLGLLGPGSRTAPPRHKTLRATLDWSYGLLEEQERILFRRLSVFSSDWTLEAAVAVGAGEGIEPGELLDLLGSLIEKSLVLAGTQREGPSSYRMLEPVRQYARERLEESGEVGATCKRHAGWCLELVETADAKLRGPEQASWGERLESAHPDLRAALEWLLERDQEKALLLAGTLGHFWHAHGHILEGRRWLEAALSRTTVFQTPMRARALHVAGVLSETSGLYGRARELYEESLMLWRELGSEKDVSTVLSSLGSLSFSAGDLARAAELTRESLALKRQLGDAQGVEISLSNLGEIAQARGDLEQARAYFEESLQMARNLENSRSIAFGLLNLGRLAVERGEPDRAEDLLLEALREFQRVGDAESTVESIRALGWVAGMRGKPEKSARLLGAAGAAQEKLGVLVGPVEQQRNKRLTVLSRQGVNIDSWMVFLEEGRAMPIQKAVQYALSCEDEEGSWPKAQPAEGPVLSNREREIALLISRGLTNRQIASELVLSRHTVNAHVHNILRKLGLRSRTQLAARMVEQSPYSGRTE